MPDPSPPPPKRFRFGIFEADYSSGELRRKGVRVKLHSQPFQVLFILLERPGEIVTREEISRELWPDGTFVDFEHGVNSAVNRLREALGDKATNPRFVETLPRRGYRFLASVEPIQPPAANSAKAVPHAVAAQEIPDQPPPPAPETRAGLLDRVLATPVLATPEDLPKASHSVVQTLFVLLQIMYLAFYAGALGNLAEINELFASLPFATGAFLLMVITAALLIPLRIFLLCAVLFHAPGMRAKFRKIWWFLLPLDVLWSLAPFLLLHHMPFGLALACVPPLVYSPFAQRSLILMGAGDAAAIASPPPHDLPA